MGFRFLGVAVGWIGVVRWVGWWGFRFVRVMGGSDSGFE